MSVLAGPDELLAVEPDLAGDLRACEPLCRPRIACSVTDLPEPDSPTMPRISPRATSKDDAVDALTMPSSVGNWTRRSRTLQEGVGRRLGGDGLDVDGDALSPGHGHLARRLTARDTGTINSTSPWGR